MEPQEFSKLQNYHSAYSKNTLKTATDTADLSDLYKDLTTTVMSFRHALQQHHLNSEENPIAAKLRFVQNSQHPAAALEPSAGAGLLWIALTTSFVYFVFTQ